MKRFVIKLINVVANVILIPFAAIISLAYIATAAISIAWTYALVRLGSDQYLYPFGSLTTCYKQLYEQFYEMYKDIAE